MSEASLHAVRMDYKNNKIREIRDGIEEVLRKALTRDQIEPLIKACMGEGFFYNRWRIGYEEYRGESDCLNLWVYVLLEEEEHFVFNLPAHLLVDYDGPVPTEPIIDMEFDFS